MKIKPDTSGLDPRVQFGPKGRRYRWRNLRAAEVVLDARVEPEHDREVTGGMTHPPLPPRRDSAAGP